MSLLMKVLRFAAVLAMLLKACWYGPARLLKSVNTSGFEQVSLTIVEGPSTHADPSLKSRLLLFQLGEATQQLARVLVHWNNVESGGMEEDKGKVEMRKTIKIEVFGRHLAACPGVGPRLVVANVYALDATTIFAARWSLDVAAASKVFLASFVAKQGCRAAESTCQCQLR